MLLMHSSGCVVEMALTRHIVRPLLLVLKLLMDLVGCLVVPHLNIDLVLHGEVVGSCSPTHSVVIIRRVLMHGLPAARLLLKLLLAELLLLLLLMLMILSHVVGISLNNTTNSIHLLRVLAGHHLALLLGGSLRPSCGILLLFLLIVLWHAG